MRPDFQTWALSLCELVASRSRDPHRKCGAAIFRPDKTLVSIGYNGFSRGIDDDPSIYLDRPRKLLRIVHAEMNALLMANEPLKGCTLFCTPFFSCANCAACMIQKGISRVVILDKEEGGQRWKASFEEAAQLFKEAGVQVDIINMKDTQLDTNLYIKDIIPMLKWRVSGGAKYMWKCYGNDCRITDFGDYNDTYHVSAVYDVETARIVELTGYGSLFTLTSDDLPWRWIDPDFVIAYETECKNKNINSSIAWDDVRYNDIDKDEVLRLLDIVHAG